MKKRTKPGCELRLSFILQSCFLVPAESKFKNTMLIEIANGIGNLLMETVLTSEEDERDYMTVTIDSSIKRM